METNNITRESIKKCRPELYFVNILIAIDTINRKIKNISFKKFIEDEVIFGTIAFGIKEIIKNLKLLNSFSHNINFKGCDTHMAEHFPAKSQKLFLTAKEEIPIFEKQFFEFLEKIGNKTYILKAINYTIPIYEKMHRHESVEYLKMSSNKLKQVQ